MLGVSLDVFTPGSIAVYEEHHLSFIQSAKCEPSEKWRKTDASDSVLQWLIENVFPNYCWNQHAVHLF